jgi:outer membrane receptor for ferric coprogen and ferric-rhodotorulic acid
MDPSHVTQYTVGWNGRFLDEMLTAEIDLYAKKMEDLIAYREG